jgi:beta-galactosidase
MLDLDTEGLAPIADGGDLVAVNAVLADKNGTPKRYDTEKILFSVEGEADIVGENPQVTRWGEAVVLIRPRAAKKPKPITIRAKTVRKGQYAPKAGKITFTPGKAKIEKYSFDNDPNQNDKNLRQVEEQQHEFETKG